MKPFKVRHRDNCDYVYKTEQMLYIFQIIKVLGIKIELLCQLQKWKWEGYEASVFTGDDPIKMTIKDLARTTLSKIYYNPNLQSTFISMSAKQLSAHPLTGISLAINHCAQASIFQNTLWNALHLCF